ncbi:MAG TPA: hypothetical protein VMU29_02620 [Smithella sp.]|nr:hypothetical protein [Smithella sp.]
MFHGKWKVLSGIVLLIIVAVAAYVFYLYQQGGIQNYKPPTESTETPQKQIISDLTALSSALDAYFAKYLKYPDSLDELKPEFMDKIPREAEAKAQFIYQSDEIDHYRITVTEPSRYGFKELYIENGTITQK